MKYVILDTNIYIDILFDRNRNVKKSLVESFIKLLDNNQVTLVVPEIVKFETLKHVDDEFAEVGKSIKNAKMPTATTRLTLRRRRRQQGRRLISCSIFLSNTKPITKAVLKT